MLKFHVTKLKLFPVSVKFEVTDLPFAFCFYFVQPGSRKPSPSVQLTETLNCFTEQSAAGSRIDN